MKIFLKFDFCSILHAYIYVLDILFKDILGLLQYVDSGYTMGRLTSGHAGGSGSKDCIN